MQDSRSNRKLIFNYPRKFVENETGYLLGKPVNYISKTDNAGIIDKIDHETSHWEKEHNIQLRKHSEIYGESYELHYVNKEGEFSATILMILQYCNVTELPERYHPTYIDLAVHLYKHRNAEGLHRKSEGERTFIYEDGIPFHIKSALPLPRIQVGGYLV